MRATDLPRSDNRHSTPVQFAERFVEEDVEFQQNQVQSWRDSVLYGFSIYLGSGTPSHSLFNKSRLERLDRSWARPIVPFQWHLFSLPNAKWLCIDGGHLACHPQCCQYTEASLAHMVVCDNLQDAKSLLSFLTMFLYLRNCLT